LGRLGLGHGLGLGLGLGLEASGLGGRVNTGAIRTAILGNKCHKIFGHGFGGIIIDDLVADQNCKIRIDIS
jgi:hypothetical protein